MTPSYVSLSDNEKTGFKARELKSVHVDAVGHYLKLNIHKNHVNKHNLYNQVTFNYLILKWKCLHLEYFFKLKSLIFVSFLRRWIRDWSVSGPATRGLEIGSRTHPDCRPGCGVVIHLGTNRMVLSIKSRKKTRCRHSWVLFRGCLVLLQLDLRTISVTVIMFSQVTRRPHF